MENREKVIVLLKEVGVSPANLGWKYLNEAILMVLEDASLLDNIIKGLYRGIADRFDTVPSRVERAIRHGVIGAFDNMPEDVKYEIFGNTTRCLGKATNSEFIGTLAEVIKSEPNNPIWTREKKRGTIKEVK